MALEHLLVAVVVADRGKNRGIRRQRDRGQRLAVEAQTRQEFARDMLGVGGAAAVAGKHHLAAGAQAAFDRLRDGEHGGAKLGVAGRAGEHVERTAEMRGGDIVVRH